MDVNVPADHSQMAAELHGYKAVVLGEYSDGLWLTGPIYSEQRYRAIAISQCFVKAQAPPKAATRARWWRSSRGGDKVTHTLEGCRCGFHIFKRFRDVVEYEIWADPSMYGCLVAGAVVWGPEVLEGQRGYRATNLTLTTLYIPRTCTGKGCNETVHRMVVLPTTRALDTDKGVLLGGRCGMHSGDTGYSLNDVAAQIGVKVELSASLTPDPVIGGVQDVMDKIQALQATLRELDKD